MAVEFEKYGRLYYLDAGTTEYQIGDKVLFPIGSGEYAVALCVWPPQDLDWKAGELPVCGGQASLADLARDAETKRQKANYWKQAEAIIKAHDLPMKVVGIDIEHIDDNQVVAIYYTAPERVDFRALVRELAIGLDSKIDLRQLGTREAASLVGGCGTCGRELCCVTMGLPAEPVPSRTIRVQEIGADPFQIAGICGRLRCCLTYEYDRYVDFLVTAPQIGSSYQGGRVLEIRPANEEVVIEKNGEIRRCRVRDN